MTDAPARTCGPCKRGPPPMTAADHIPGGGPLLLMTPFNNNDRRNSIA